MSFLYVAGQYGNLGAAAPAAVGSRAPVITMSPAVDALFPTTGLGDGLLGRASMHGSNAADPSITWDLAAFTPAGAGTYYIVARAGERRRISGATSATLQNLSTKKYLTNAGGWQVASSNITTAVNYQVESLTLCQSPIVLLKLVVTTGTTGDWPRWNGMLVMGHNLDAGLTVEMRSSTDNFGASNVLEVTGAIKQPGFFMYKDQTGVANRYARLKLTGTNQSAPWYCEAFPAWFESATAGPDWGFEVSYIENQIRNEGRFGVTGASNLSPQQRRAIRMSFGTGATAGTEIRQEMVWRGRGGVYPMVVIPLDTEPAVYYVRLTDRWAETRQFYARFDGDLTGAEDAIAAPLV